MLSEDFGRLGGVVVVDCGVVGVGYDVCVVGVVDCYDCETLGGDY